MRGDNKETVITPWKIETAAQNKPQLQTLVRAFKSTAQAPLLLAGGQHSTRAGPSTARRSTQATESSCRSLARQPARPTPPAGLRFGLSRGAEPGRTRLACPCAGEPVAAGRSHMAALGPGRPRPAVGGASSHRPAAPKRSAAGGSQTGWGGSVWAHGESGRRPGASAGILTLRRGT